MFFLFLLCCSETEKENTPYILTKEEEESKRKRSDQRSLKFIAEDVSCLRGKEFSPVPFLAYQKTEDFREFVQKDIDKELNNTKGETFSYTLKGLRLLPFDFNLKQSYIDMLSEQAAAYYDPQTKGFYIVQQMQGFMLKATIAHELQHSLQDQHTDLLSKYTSDYFQSFDHEMASRFLIEGEATLIGNTWLMQNMSSVFGLGGKECLSETPSDEQFRFWSSIEDFIKDTAFATREQNTNIPKWMQLLLSMSMPMDAVQESLKNLPMFHYYMLNTPYLRGSWYAYAKLRQSGWKRSGLDQLFKNPPQTTEQTLHPEKNHIPPPVPNPVQLPAHITEGWTAHPPDTMGEMGIVIWLIQHGLSEEKAYKHAEGWNGDRVQVWTKSSTSNNNPTSYAISWKILWDSPALAQKGRKSIQAQIKNSFPQWKSQQWSSKSKKGKEEFTYGDTRGHISWDQAQLTLWWGF